MNVTAQCYKRPKIPENPALAPYFTWKGEIGCTHSIEPGDALFGPQADRSPMVSRSAQEEAMLFYEDDDDEEAGND